jgi:hypothetical protein
LVAQKIETLEHDEQEEKQKQEEQDHEYEHACDGFSVPIE